MVAASSLPCNERGDHADDLADPEHAVHTQDDWLFHSDPEAGSRHRVLRASLCVCIACGQARCIAEVARLRGLGATEYATHQEHGMTWTVMTDPEGNEFCIVQA